ncbi:MAG: hypothetical protein LBP20_08600 [Treponema sp.]|nr:hypothetical protein [Treponema sp.]
MNEKGAVLEIPARLPPDTTRRIQELAVKTFTVLNGEGLSRVDFFLTTRGGEEHILVNEI